MGKRKFFKEKTDSRAMHADAKGVQEYRRERRGAQERRRR